MAEEKAEQIANMIAAAESGNLDDLKYYVLDEEVDVNTKGSANRTALHAACANGHEEVAKVFQETASQEIKHALAHCELIYPAELVDTKKALNLAIEGETYEYTEMYPGFHRDAIKEGNHAAKRELEDQMQESKEHAKHYQETLSKV